MPATKSPQTLGAVRVWEPYRHSAGLKGLPDYSTIGTGHGWLGSTKSAFIANGYLSLPGTGGNDATAPDSAALSVTGSFEIVTRIFNSAPAAFGMLMGKDAVTGGGAGSRSFAFYVDNSGKLGVALSTDGSAASTVLSSVAPSAAAGVTYWAKVTRDSVTGNVIFYTAADQSTEPSSWTQLGTTQVGPTGALFDSTQLLRIGNGGNGTSLLFSGGVYRSILRSSIGGTIVFDANFAAQAVGTTLFLESSSNAATVTINSSAADTNDPIYEGARIQSGALVLPGVASNYATLPDNYDWSTGVCVSIRLTPDNWASGSFQCVAAQSDNSTVKSWGFFIQPSGGITVQTCNDGSTLVYNTTLATYAQLGSPTGAMWLRFSYVPNVGGQGQARVEYAADAASEPSSWTVANTLTSAAAHTLFNSTTANSIGAYGVAGATLPFTGGIKRVIYRNLAAGAKLADVDFTTATAAATSFAESTAGATVTINSTNAVPGLTFATDDYVQAPDATDLAFGAAMTVFGVVKIATPGATAAIVDQYDTNAARAFAAFATTGGKLRAILSADGGSTNVKDYTGSQTFADNTWRSFAITYAAGTTTLYVNALADGSPTKTTDNTVASLFNTTANLMIGASLATAAAANNLTGSEAAIALFPTALSAFDVGMLHNYYAAALAADGITLVPAGGVLGRINLGLGGGL
jgi:hypothetical protein